MCGIAGYSGNFDPRRLEEASRLQKHRGPDANGLWFDSTHGVGLAHRRLSILDLTSTGDQPMLSDDGSVVLAFNGEIYSHRELRAELEAGGHRFRGSSDTEVLLRLYLDRGTDMLDQLNGMFAFAIWDNRNQSLFLARDALGVKPLYYAETTNGFAFASEVKALTAMFHGSRELDIASIHRYLSFLWCPGVGTPFKAVKKMLPGEAMSIRNGQVLRRWTWYRLPAQRGMVTTLSLEDAVEGTARGLRHAVARQMVADVPVGAFLSGGLDSSAIVALARESKPDIRCFTMDTTGGPESGTADDLPYARKVATHLGVKLDVIQVDAGRIASDIERMVRQLDEPLADPAALNVLYISQLAREHGFKVLLSGAGGDDVFSGYRRHVALQYEAAWRWLPKGMRSAISDFTSTLDQHRPFARRMRKVLSVATKPDDARLSSYFLWADETNLMKLYSREVRALLQRQRADQPMREFLEELPPTASELQRMLALEQRFFLADHNLIYTDKMSMAASVEVRVPFLDLELVEFAARIPDRYKQRGSRGKWVLRKAMEPYLPRDIIYRPKTGFGAPLRRWIRRDLNHLLTDFLSPESIASRGLFDPGAVQALIKANEDGRTDASYTLLSLLCIEIWCRAFSDTSASSHPRAHVGIA